MASSKNSFNTKPPKGRPASTSAISQPSLAETLPILSKFSLDGTLFALVTLAIDKHRLRVYNAISGCAIAEHTVQTGRVTSLIWSTSTPGAESSAQESNPSKKRKKRRSDIEGGQEELSQESEVVILGLSDGTILIFSPVHSKVVSTLSQSTSTSSILSLALGLSNKSLLWTSSADSSVNLWDLHKNIVLRSWKTDDRIPYTSLCIRPPSEEDTESDLLAAHHRICLLADVCAAQGSASTTPKQSATFTGHASSIKILRWAKATEASHRFFSVAEGDRFVCIWDSEGASKNEKPIASISVDSDVRLIELNTLDPSKQILVVLSTSGKLSFVPIPVELPLLQGIGDKSHKIHTLLPRSTLTSVSKSKTDPPIINLALTHDSGSVRVVRLVKGIQPVFDVVRYLDDSGNYIQSPSINELSQIAVDETLQFATTKRYIEPSSLGTSSGIDPDHVESNEYSVAQHEVDGSLQVDLAELSLGQRLATVADVDIEASSGSNDDDDAERAPRNKSVKKTGRNEISVIPANSLTRTLIQALHSSDSRLLEMCLAHSDPILIRNTVRRLPPQLAIPLINACVERLGRGARVANMKGGGGGASSQRGMALVTWVNLVLAVHTGHLMTIPDLVARLSGLHTTLTARLSLHDSLLSLSGRLDTVLSQVEYRTSTTPASLGPPLGKVAKATQQGIVRRYVEGESDSEEEDSMDVEIEEGSAEEGNVEDVELGGSESEDDEEDDDSEDSEEGNSLIDDEAEEEFTDEEDEEDSE